MASASPTDSLSEPGNRPNRPHPRKGHRKSRKGCFNCKRRKIKCQETLPSCANCKRSSLICQYSDMPAVVGSPSSPTAVVHSTADSFSLTDMRLFHHFLTAAYPHYPLKSEHIWLNRITPIAHQCEYLMHALLALSASHLEKTAPANLTGLARSHARAAMEGLNAALGQPVTTAEVGDAAIATCYALLMQSWFMDDGLSSFLILSRSCKAVSGQIKESGVAAIFTQEDRRSQIEQVKERFEGAPAFNPSFTTHALESLEALRSLCCTFFGLRFIDKIAECLRALCTSPYQAYLLHVDLDEMITAMTLDECEQMLDTQNQVCQLLAAHMVAMYLILRPVSCRERTQYNDTAYGSRMLRWIDNINEGLESEYKDYITWPLILSELNRNNLLEHYTLWEKRAAPWDRKAIEVGELSAPAIALLDSVNRTTSMLPSPPLVDG